LQTSEYEADKSLGKAFVGILSIAPHNINFLRKSLYYNNKVYATFFNKPLVSYIKLLYTPYSFSSATNFKNKQR
jgi:hypothetical protein